MKKKGRQTTGDKQRAKQMPVNIPVHIFAEHRQMQSLDPLMSARPEASKNSWLREAVALQRPKVSSISFPPIQQIKKTLGESVCHACESAGEYGSGGLESVMPRSDAERVLPKAWVRALPDENDRVCPSMHKMVFFSNVPSMRLHALRHASAHAGGWDALRSDDRNRVAYVVHGRLRSPDRIRFAHAESCSKESDRIREYWAELLAFALGIPAGGKTEWRNAFAARAVQRSAGAPLAYPMVETGIKDRDLAEWHFKQSGISEPWEFANRSVEWMDRTAREDRTARIRHVASGFPAGKLRSVYTGLMHTDPAPVDHTRALKRAEVAVPAHVVSWIERACLLADELASLEHSVAVKDREPLPLFSAAAELAGEWSRFSHEDQQRLLRALTEYMQELSV